MRKMFVLLATIALLATACNNGNQPDSVKAAEKQNDKQDTSGVTLLGDNTDSLDFDKDFMVEAASGGLLEVQLGQIAQQNASATQVKAFGKMMVADHTTANNELTALAKQKNIVVPATPGKKALEHIEKLQQLKGTDFDKDYVNLMVDDHEKDIEEFEKAAEKATDPDIKALAVKNPAYIKAPPANDTGYSGWYKAISWVKTKQAQHRTYYNKIGIPALH